MPISKAACHGGRRISEYLAHSKRANLAQRCSSAESRVDDRKRKAWSRNGTMLATSSAIIPIPISCSRTGPFPYTEFAADFLRNEPIVASYRQRTRLFRYPFLKEGDTAEKRDRFRSLLQRARVPSGARDHRFVGLVRRSAHPRENGKGSARESRSVSRLPRRPLIGSRCLLPQALARRLGETEIPHALLIHYSFMNALFLPAVLDAFDQAGWDWIDASRAYKDSVFQSAPQILPAGESLVWALAKETGKFDGLLRYPGEDDEYEKPKMDALGL